ncbi:MAG: protein kinase [Oscillatoriales cyanobacterium SM2_2_1]|nr:protein kinase [Oscillatoriales cyanobacterium SM2_2_1]
MSYCINPHCLQPENEAGLERCNSCGSALRLRSRYRAEKLLGQGGFGRTYLAIDEDRLNAKCVIKQFLPQLNSTSDREKATQLFNQEAVRLHELGVHPQIPNLLAYFVEEGQQYLVQEFVEGDNLLQMLQKRGAFSEADVRRLLLELLEILQFVHERQVVHRDIKPENILQHELTKKFFLIDFGVAKTFDAQAFAQTGTAVGSSGYMPMELLTGGRVTPAADIYSLGVTAFQMLTALSPHKLFVRYGFSWLPKWRNALKHPISPDWAEVIDHMIRPDEGERFATAGEVLRAIAKIEEATVVQKMSAPTSGSDLDVILTSFLQDVTAAESSDNPVTIAQLQDGSAATREDDIDVLLRDFHPASFAQAPAYELTVDLRYSQDWQCTRSLAYEQGVSQMMFWDKDRLILAGDRREVWMAQPNTGKVLGVVIDRNSCRTCSGTGRVERPGRVLLVETMQRVTCPDCSGFGRSPDHAEEFAAVAVNPVRHQVAIATPGHSIKIFDLEKRSFINAIQPKATASALVYDGGGDYLAAIVERHLVYLWNVQTRDRIFLERLQSQLNCLALSVDGQILAVGSDDCCVRVWHVPSGRLIAVLQAHQKPVQALTFADDGRTLVSGSRGHTIRVWNWQSGKLLFDLKGHETPITALTFLEQSNQMLASGSEDGTVKLWDLTHAALTESLRRHQTPITALASFGPCLVSASRDGAVHFWQQAGDRAGKS